MVVGGGSSGCIVAAELARDPTLRVVLLERGGPAEDNPETLSASGYKDAFVNDRVIWTRHTVPQAALGGRRVFAGTGTGIGGSGGVNGMVYTRGCREDYDAWPAGWQWDDVVPDFEAVEERLRPAPRPPTAWTEASIAAAVANGFRRVVDLNAGGLSGVFGYEAMNHDGVERRHSYVGFLREAMATCPNLTVLTAAQVRRVRFTEGHASAVELRHGGADHVIAVRREVVLCGGALETPKLLLLSGVGPADDLRALGIPVVADVPGIGRNLHDHPNVILLFRGTSQEVDCAQPQLYGFHRVNEALPLAPGQPDTCYVMYPARSSFRQAAERMLPSAVLPGALLDVPWLSRWTRRLARWVFGLGLVRRQVDRMWGVVVILGKPLSRGQLRLRSSDPDVPADIDPAYLTASEDRETMQRGLELACRLAASKALRPWFGGKLLPLTWGSLAAHARRQLITTFHFAGTCRMGHDDAAPVDTQLRLRGVSGVRVADASVIPQTPVSALNAPSMMIGWRAARLVREALASGGHGSATAHASRRT